MISNGAYREVIFPYQIIETLSSIPEKGAVQCLKRSRNNPQLDEGRLIQDLHSIFEFMNCPYPERELKLGHPLLGFHYGSHLVDCLNEHYVVRLDRRPFQVRDMSGRGQCQHTKWNPDCWERDSDNLGLTYHGSNPSRALDELFRGPTVIDCAMAMQVALFMAIKKQIGNERFDIAFGKQPLRISMNLHTEDHATYGGNPFYDFFSTAAVSRICTKYFSNYITYEAKHGGDGGVRWL